MKKVLLVVVLFLTIIVISYIQVNRQESREKSLYQTGLKDGTEEVGKIKGAIDSLKQVVDSQSIGFTDELGRTKQTYDEKIDSLKNVVVSQDQKISELSDNKKPVTKNILQDKSQSTEQNHTQILSYYKSRFNELPVDLSEYEKRVALKEIREETAQKYSITIEELNTIRKDNNLDY